MSDKQRRGGLGRGIGALIPSGPSHASNAATAIAPPRIPDAPGLAPVDGAQFADLPITSIHANAKQPRQVFDEDALAELTHSVAEFGLLQPIVVRPDGDGYELDRKSVV